MFVSETIASSFHGFYLHETDCITLSDFEYVLPKHYHLTISFCFTIGLSLVDLSGESFGKFPLYVWELLFRSNETSVSDNQKEKMFLPKEIQLQRFVHLICAKRQTASCFSFSSIESTIHLCGKFLGIVFDICKIL